MTQLALVAKREVEPEVLQSMTSSSFCLTAVGNHLKEHYTAIYSSG